jgi:hypothetical protein
MKVLVNVTGRYGEGSCERNDGLGLADNNPIILLDAIGNYEADSLRLRIGLHEVPL